MTPFVNDSRVTRCTPLRTSTPKCSRRWDDCIGDLEADSVEAKIRDFIAAPIQRHDVSGLLVGTWARRHQLRLVDAVYVELAVSRNVPLITTDRRLRDAPSVDVLGT